MKQINSKLIIFSILISALLLSACGAKATADPNQKMTEIAATVQAQLTQSAPIIPTNTNTPVAPTETLTITPAAPTNTPEGAAATSTMVVIPSQPSGTSDDDANFVSDVTIPDGSTLKAGEQFTKTWRFQNIGKTTWTTDYAIQYLEGNLMGKDSALTFKLAKNVAPGEYGDVSVIFTAPLEPGVYSSYWKLLSVDGYYFGDVVSITIKVGTPTPTIPGLTATPVPTATKKPKTATPTVVTPTEETTEEPTEEPTADPS